MAASACDEGNNVNILLLGETGVGKSTFINAFANYLKHDKLPDKLDQLVHLIPTSFTLYNDNYEQVQVTFGDESNQESFKVGAAATRYPACYEFPLSDRKVRIIDTPGIGDPRGITQDNINFENILSFISDFEYLHCICILLKPNQSRISITFDFCIKQLLCHLQKDASQNIVFVYTNARGTFYKPGDTAPMLITMLETIKIRPPNINIVHDKQRVFCMDNEAFRFMVAKQKGVTFDNDTKRNFESSWDKSASECQRLMRYIIGCKQDNQTPLKPHKIKDTVSVNTARKMINDLSRPLADIINNIAINLTVLQKHKKAIKMTSSNIEELRKKLHIPVVIMNVLTYDQPRTACSNIKCSEVKSIDGVQRYVHKNMCHNPCRLKNVPREIIGHPDLLLCLAIDEKTGNCKVCGCSYLVHMHMYYGIEEKEDVSVDNVVEAIINAETDAIQATKIVLEESEKRIVAYKKEQQIVAEAVAKFAHFLKNNAILSYNDALISYIEYKISNLRAHEVHGDDTEMFIKELEAIKSSYKVKVDELEKAIKDTDGKDYEEVTADKIVEIIESLKMLEISGKKIKEMLKAQEAAMTEEFHKKMFIVHETDPVRFFNFIFIRGRKFTTALVPVDKLNFFQS